MPHQLDVLVFAYTPPSAPVRRRHPPMKISMMLHFYAVCEPFAPEKTRTSRAYTKFVKELLSEGLIERPSNEERALYPGWAYRATAKGDAWVNAICGTQLPVAETAWSVPR